MENGKHTKFILTPIFEILEDCVNATKGISSGIETYPLCDYIMQTTFLKMTGASEQKLKCILWEIATNDYTFRYEFLKTSYGECSALDDKKKVFNVLKDQVKAMNPDKELFDKIYDNDTKTKIQEKSGQEIILLFEHSILSIWQGKEFNNFKDYSSDLINNHFCNFPTKKNQIDKRNISLIDGIIDYYRIVFKHRNRCAHNLKSYQTNLPDLSVLVNKEYDYENYFFRFSILVLLDEIFMKMYSEYLNLLENNI